MGPQEFLVLGCPGGQVCVRVLRPAAQALPVEGVGTGKSSPCWDPAAFPRGRPSGMRLLARLPRGSWRGLLRGRTGPWGGRKPVQCGCLDGPAGPLAWCSHRVPTRSPEAMRSWTQRMRSSGSPAALALAWSLHRVGTLRLLVAQCLAHPQCLWEGCVLVMLCCWQGKLSGS